MEALDEEIKSVSGISYMPKHNRSSRLRRNSSSNSIGEGDLKFVDDNS